MSGYIMASDFVHRIVRKYKVRSGWVWELLEDECNIIKGIGYLMTAEQAVTMDAVISDIINEDL